MRQQEWENPSLAGKKQRSAVVLNKKAGGLREEQVYTEGAERAGQMAGCSWTEAPAGAGESKVLLLDFPGGTAAPPPHTPPASRFPFLFLSLLPPSFPY